MVGMIKTVPPGSYLWDSPQTSFIKVAGSGRFTGQDRREFLKSASGLFLPRLREICDSIKPGDVPVHVLSHGFTEFTGPNRNGDGFPKEACEKFAWTFEKLSHWFRLHRNKDPMERYGICKAAAVNPLMGRVELIYFLNGTKEAADRNGGHIADAELEDLGRRGDVMTSMSCFLNPATPITTETGITHIADIGVGQRVWTHLGRLQEVTALNHRLYTGTCVRLHTTAGTFEVTAEHPWLVRFHREEDEPGELYNDWKLSADLVAGIHFLMKPINKAAGFGGSDMVAITAVETFEVTDQMVYNFEVANDESYLAHGLISHNCKVPADFCSSCNNRATKRAEYCGDACPHGGLKYNLGRTFADGTKLHAVNREPYWFDTSYIPTKQADAIAYGSRAEYLTKAAEFHKSGAEISEDLHLSVPAEVDYLVAHPKAWAKRGSLDRAASLAHSLARWEKSAELPPMGVATSGLDVSRLPAWTDKSAASSLRRLVDGGIFLSPQDFLKWVRPNAGVEFTVKFAAALKTAYADLADSPRLFEGPMVSLDVGSELAKQADARTLSMLDVAKMMADHSLHPDFVYRRTIEKAASGQRWLVGPTNGDVVVTDEAKQLAGHYAMYKLAALDYYRRQRSSGEMPWSEKLEQFVVGQNRLCC